MKKLRLGYFPKNYRLLIGYASAIALNLFVPLTANAVPQSNASLTQLPGLEQTTLKAGRIVLTGEKGHYTGRVLVTAPLNTAWNVVTDYDHFKNFIPGVVSSQILQNNGDQTIFERLYSDTLLRGISLRGIYWRCGHCYQEMPVWKLRRGPGRVIFSRTYTIHTRFHSLAAEMLVKYTLWQFLTLFFQIL